MNSLVHSLLRKYYEPHDGFQHNFATIKTPLMFAMDDWILVWKEVSVCYLVVVPVELIAAVGR